MGQKYVFATGLTEIRMNPTQTTLAEQIGTIRMENNAVYKYVAFSGATVIAAGDVLCYVASGSDGSAVKVDSANTNLAAGVAMAALAAGTIASGALYYATGWIQIKGLATLSTALAGSPAAGDALTTNDASAPAVTLVNSAEEQACCYAYDVSGKKVLCDFPF